MDPKEYLEGVLKTERIDESGVIERLSKPGMARLLHAAVGMATESGEFLDAIKKHLFYGKPLDKINCLEEIGDQLWYAGAALNQLGFDFPEAMQRNHDKLFARYREGFTEKDAVNRNLDTERGILEAGWHKVEGGMVGVNVGANQKSEK